MQDRYLTVDGMLSGTGIRNSVAGGYIDPKKLGLSEDLITEIARWLSQYEEEHFAGFEDDQKIEKLDQEGISISLKLQRELPESKIEYYSHARTSKLPLP
jgi:hypothetical protein